MKAATLASSGRMLALHPAADPRNDSIGVRMVCRAAGTRYHDVDKAEVLPIRELPTLVRTAVERGLTIRPKLSALDAVAAEVQRLRAESAFLERVSSDITLFPYQSEGVGFLWKNPAALLFDEMGLGKTVQGCMAIQPDGAALVVCPAAVKRGWLNECKRWRPDLTPEVLQGRKSFRWPEPGEMLIINYDILPQDPDQCGKAWHETHIIFDEAHMLKNGRSNRTRASRKLIRRVRKRNGYAWLLTGTPLQNQPNELWSLLVSLDLHKSCYGSMSKFARLFGGVQDAFGYAWTGEVQPGALEPLKMHALRRERVDVLPDLPTKSYRTLEVDPPRGELARNLDDLDVDSILEMLARDSLGSLDVVDGLASCRRELAWHKYEQALPAIKAHEDEGEPLVVFSYHKAPIIDLGQREGWAAIHGGVSHAKRDKAMEDFQAGKLKGIACTIGAAGTGITLHHSARALFLDVSFVPTQNLQAEDRVLRIGQSRGVFITHVVCDHHLDKHVTDVITSKMKMISTATNQLTTQAPAAYDRDALAQELENILGMMRCS